MDKISYVQAIRNALFANLGESEKTFIIGLGADYPNGADGSHQGLAAAYPTQIYDTPTSESALTGLAVGAAAAGLRSHRTTPQDSSRHGRTPDTVRGFITEGAALYPGAGFHEKTHIKICVCNPAQIKGVFHSVA